MADFECQRCGGCCGGPAGWGVDFPQGRRVDRPAWRGKDSAIYAERTGIPGLLERLGILRPRQTHGVYWSSWVGVTPEECDRIAAATGMTPEEYRRKIAPPTATEEQQAAGCPPCNMIFCYDKPCPHYDQSTQLCTVHEIKPQQCRAFPTQHAAFQARNPIFLERWSRHCPGLRKLVEEEAAEAASNTTPGATPGKE